MDYLSEAANFPMGRQDQSRSPPRQDYQPDFRGRGSRRMDDDMYNDSQFSRFEEPLSRRGTNARGGGQYPRSDHDYGGMYDEGGYQGEGDYGYDQQGGERYRNRHSRSREGDDRKISSESGSQHNRDYSHSPTRDAGKPSDTIILEGLPFSVSSSELRDSILSDTIAADFPSIDIRVSASKGNRRAFVQFQEVDHAVAFMKENFPKLFVQLSQTTDDVPEGKFDAFIHYARSRENRDELVARVANSNDWTCPTCDFSNYAIRTKCKVCGGPQAAPNWQQSLTGVTDAANVPSQILVVYPLAPFVAEEIFTQDIKRLEAEKIEPTRDQAGAPKLKSTAPSGNTSGYGARPGSLHRTFLMRDASTDESFKYGFVEFWTIEDAAAAVTKFQMSRTFTVAACPVTVSTTHMGVFLPEDREITPAIERMSFHPLFNPSLRVRYRDYHVYPSQTIVTTQPPGSATTKLCTDETNEAKKSKKRKADANLPGTSKKLVPMAGTLAMWQKKADELRIGPGASKNAPRDPGDALPGCGTGVNAPIKISLSSATKFADSAPQEEKKVEPQPATETTPISYVDRDRLMCLICMRKYKSVDEVNIHEKSRNHKNSTENEDLVKAARPRLAIRDKRLQKQAQENPDAASSSLYRDRAKERRQAHNQPTKPSMNPPTTKPKSAPKAEPPAAAAPLAQSKGAGMLVKMGWTSGVGLGANNDGRTQVVETNAYQEGVGLGAEGGNLGDAAQLAERKTKNSYAEYVNTVQDKARERYNRMD